jgi:hypothetical protein
MDAASEAREEGEEEGEGGEASSSSSSSSALAGGGVDQDKDKDKGHGGELDGGRRKDVAQLISKRRNHEAYRDPSPTSELMVRSFLRCDLK